MYLYNATTKYILFLKSPAEILISSEKASSKSDARLALVDTIIVLRIIMVILITTLVSRIPGSWLVMSSSSSSWCRLMVEKMTVKSRGRSGRLRLQERNIILVLQHLLNNDGGDVIVGLKVHHQRIL